MKTIQLFEIIIIIAFIITAILITPYRKYSIDIQNKTVNKLELINKMSDSNKKAEGFCIDNGERPIVYNKEKEGSLYLTEHIDYIINQKLII